MTNDSMQTPENAKLPWFGLNDEALLKVAAFIGLACIEDEVDSEDVPFVAMGAIITLNALAFCADAYADDDKESFDRRSSIFHDAITNTESGKDKISSVAISRQIEKAFRKGGRA